MCKINSYSKFKQSVALQKKKWILKKVSIWNKIIKFRLTSWMILAHQRDG